MNETEKRDRRDEKEEIRYHVIFYGQVQGVGFRYRELFLHPMGEGGSGKTERKENLYSFL